MRKHLPDHTSGLSWYDPETTRAGSNNLANQRLLHYCYKGSHKPGTMDENKKKQIRLKQRFENFKRASDLLNDALHIDSPSKTEQAGIIQFFEMTFELSWKCLKDYLEIQGLDPKYPRDTIKTAVQNKIIDNGEVWLKALTDQNMAAHTYPALFTNNLEMIFLNFNNTLSFIFKSRKK